MTLEEALAALKAAQQKIDSLSLELKKHADEKNEAKVLELQKKLDAATAALDAAKADVKRVEDAHAAKAQADSAIAEKVSIIDGARALHGAAWLADGKTPTVDVTATNRDIMVAALKSRDKEFVADGKSDAYIAAAFDIAVRAQKKADASNARMNAGTAVGGTANLDGSPNVQFVTDETARGVREYDAAVFGNQAFMMSAYKGKEAAEKARDEVVKQVMDGKALGRGFAKPQFDGADMMDRAVAWLKENVSRADLKTYGRVADLRQDSDPSTAFFLRQLLYVITKPYNVIYSEIKYATLWPITYEVPTGARTWAAHLFDELGAADIVDDYADDAPDAEIKGSELIGRIFPVRSQFTFSLQDVRSAMLAGTPLDAMKAQVARRIIERKCDALAAIGDSKRSMTGFANDSNLTTVTASTKKAGGTKWITASTGVINATPDEMLADINLLYWGIFNATQGNIEADTLYVGKGVWGVMNTVRLDQFNQTTVGAYLREKLPWLKRIEYWPRLNTAGASSVERCLMAKVDPEYARAVIPQEFEVLPPQPRNMSWINPCHKRWGEPQVMQPKSLAVMDGLVG